MIREITTTNELNELPHLTLVLRHYTSPSGRKHHEVWERRNNTWHCLAAPLNPPGHTDGTPKLPVELIWTPKPEPMKYRLSPATVAMDRLMNEHFDHVRDHTHNGDDDD